MALVSRQSSWKCCCQASLLFASLRSHARTRVRSSVGVLKGGSNKEIARELGISPRTVEAYRANLMMKMGAESLSELVRMAIEARAED